MSENLKVYNNLRSVPKEAQKEIKGGKLKVTLEVKDGAIRFVDTVCPDHLCENEGFIRYEDESAICMPAGVAVLVTDEFKG